jgi:hypothetical protein
MGYGNSQRFRDGVWSGTAEPGVNLRLPIKGTSQALPLAIRRAGEAAGGAGEVAGVLVGGAPEF